MERISHVEFIQIPVRSDFKNITESLLYTEYHISLGDKVPNKT